MSVKTLRAIHGSPDRPLRIRNLEIPCYVLENGIRVLSGRGMQSALELGQSHGSRLRRFIESPTIKPHINEDLAMALANPLRFIRPGRGGKIAVGYEATILADICDAVLAARKANALKFQGHLLVAEQCEILTRGFAKVGIIALVDEATGYQEVRDKLALQEIVNKYLDKHLQAWTRTFDEEFYERLFYLRGWQYKPLSVKRPMLVAKLTIDLVYQRLAPGVLTELRKRAPRDDKGRLKYPMTRYFTTDFGHPKLKEHISNVTTLMKASSTWANFYRLLQRALPKYGDTLQIPFPEEEMEENNEPINVAWQTKNG